MLHTLTVGWKRFLSAAGVLCVVGVAVFLLGANIGAANNHLIQTYRTCADGWSSPSIGGIGACSHHGGVVTREIDRRSPEQKAWARRWEWLAEMGFWLALVSGAGWLGAIVVRIFNPPPPRRR